MPYTWERKKKKKNENYDYTNTKLHDYGCTELQGITRPKNKMKNQSMQPWFCSFSATPTNHTILFCLVSMHCLMYLLFYICTHLTLSGSCTLCLCMYYVKCIKHCTTVLKKHFVSIHAHYMEKQQ